MNRICETAKFSLGKVATFNKMPETKEHGHDERLIGKQSSPSSARPHCLLVVPPRSCVDIARHRSPPRLLYPPPRLPRSSQNAYIPTCITRRTFLVDLIRSRGLSFKQQGQNVQVRL